MLFIILITFVVCIILYYYTSSNFFSFAAKQCPAGTVNKGGQCVKQQPVQGGKKPVQSGVGKKSTQGGGKQPIQGGKKPTQGGGKNTPGKKPTQGGGKNTPGKKPIQSGGKNTPGKKPIQSGGKNTTGKKPIQSGGKNTTGKNTPGKNGNCSGGKVKIGDNCITAYKPGTSGNCKGNDLLYQGNCIKPTNLSEYSRHQLIDLGVDLPMVHIRGRPVPNKRPGGTYAPTSHSAGNSGSPVSAKINGKPVKAVSAGTNTVAYLQDGQVTYGTVDSSGNIKPVSSKSRNPIVALGVAAVAAVANYLMGQVDDPKQKALINKQVMAPFKGAGKIPIEDVKALGLKPGQTYYSNGQQYSVNAQGEIQSISCKGKCKDNVNAKQASVLQSVATDALKPGTVYQSGNNLYQVTSDGKGVEPCRARTELRSLQYRGIGGAISKLCGLGRPRPANDLVQQAIQNAPQIAGTMNYAQLTAQDFIEQHPQGTYAQYSLSTSSNNRLTEAEFNQARGQMNLPPTYQGPPDTSHNQSAIDSATRTYLQQNPNATYEEYKKKYGKGAMSFAQYNAARSQAGLAPLYQPLGQEPMNVNTFIENGYPIHNFVSQIYSQNSNTELSVPVQTSLNSMQTWLQSNPAPLQQGQGIRQWISNFMMNNVNNLGTILNNNTNPSRTTISSMLTNYIIETQPAGIDSYWAENPQVIRNLVQNAYNSIYPPSSSHASVDEIFIRGFL